MTSPAAESADIETSSADYARRFAGAAGSHLLTVQAEAVCRVIDGLPPGRVLDVGGAHGQLVDLLAARGWSVTVLGSSPECGRNLRELHHKTACDYVTGDLIDMPFADRSFDLVVSVRLVSHAERWQALLAGMCRVARTAVVIDYPSTTGLNALTPLLFGMKKSLEGNTRTYRSFSHQELAQAFAAAGFAPRSWRKQFFLPMVAHRVTGSAAPVRWVEAACRAVGLTHLAGSPVILRCDRRVEST
jgi:2-polyprenyl-3-methyl-5-hydroxy-6-metoxy-1,4-benzoquinol methylase